MTYRKFHNPKICLPIIRRRIGEEIIDLIAWYAKFCASKGKAYTWGCFPDRKNYHNAIYRLRKKGLIAYKQRCTNEGILKITPLAENKLKEEFKPQKFWNRKWSGTWFVLTYDIPESKRRYRDTLREFLKRMRMGCLQRSVYISPRDIRPEYADLDESAGVGQFSFILEAQSLTDRSDEQIVYQAWDYDHLYTIQSWFLDVYRENLSLAEAGKIPNESLSCLAREEMSAYITVMQNDPFLPNSLLPQSYKGKDVYEFHTHFVKRMSKLL